MFSRKSTNPIDRLETEITHLRDRQTGLEEKLQSTRADIDRATKQRRDLLEAATDFDDARLHEVNKVLEKSEGRALDLEDAIVLLKEQCAHAEAKLARHRDDDARAAEIARANQIIDAAHKANRDLQVALLKFNKQFRLLGWGETAAIAAEQFRTSIYPAANTAIESLEQHRDALAQGQPLRVPQ
jgi:chromosome segregation ATPase